MGSDHISLDMIKEDVYLAFRRDNKALFVVTIILFDSDKLSYQFFNELPPPLIPMMSRQWIHEHFGELERSHPPKHQFGWKELYTLLDFHIPTSMQISYELLERVEYMTFLPTSEVGW